MLKNFRVCLLTPMETARLERHGELPECEKGFHVHVSSKEAERREEDSHGRFIDDRRKYMAAEPNRVWKSRMSGGSSVLQLVRGVVRGRAGHFGVSVGAVGARERRTSVAETNFEPFGVEA